MRSSLVIPEVVRSHRIHILNTDRGRSRFCHTGYYQEVRDLGVLEQLCPLWRYFGARHANVSRCFLEAVAYSMDECFAKAQSIADIRKYAVQERESIIHNAGTPYTMLNYDFNSYKILDQDEIVKKIKL